MGTFTWEPQPHPEACRDRLAHEHGISTYTCECGGHWQQWESELPTRNWSTQAGEPLRSKGRMLNERLIEESATSCGECLTLYSKRRTSQPANPRGTAAH